MNKEIEIPEGYEARIEGNKVILEPKESEDEKIRKEIIRFINWAESRGSVRNDWLQKKCPAEWIAYLERQKEQKPIEKAEAWTIFNAKDGDILNSVRVHATIIFKSFSEDGKHINAYCALQRGILIKQEMLWDRDFEPASEYWKRALFDKFKKEGYEWDAEKKELQRIEQKPAECLKPEKDCWYVCIKDFYGGGKKQSSNGDLVQAKGGMYMMGREDISEWFRKAYYDEIKSTEWSEEDEEHINSILERLEGMCKKGATFTQTRFAVSEDKDWLKSLCLQPHWKPSEEQMEDLEYAIGLLGDMGVANTLRELCGDLKKL